MYPSTRFRSVIGLIVFAISAVSAFAQTTPKKPQVLVVLSYHVGMQWEDDITRGIFSKLGEHCDIVITQLDVRRYSIFGREKQMLEIMSNRVTTSHPVLVIAVDDFAYRYVLEHRDVFDPGIPIVFGGVNFWNGERPKGVTGIVEAMNLSDTLKLMDTLQPSSRRWVIVNDLSETGQANRKAFENIRGQYQQREILWLGDGSYGETEARLAQLDPAHDAVLLLSWNIDSTGLPRSYETAIKRAREVCPAPIYGVWDFYFEHGIIGGVLLDGFTHGSEMGDLAHRILTGESPDSIPVITQCKTRLRIDYREFQRFGFSNKQLPENAEIANRTYTAWEQYAGIIIAVAIVIVLQATTITCLVVVIQRSRQARLRLRESEANLRNTLDAIEEAVIVTDPHNKITRINPAAEKLTGIKSNEAIAHPSLLALTQTDPGA